MAVISSESPFGNLAASFGFCLKKSRSNRTSRLVSIAVISLVIGVAGTVVVRGDPVGS